MKPLPATLVLPLHFDGYGLWHRKSPLLLAGRGREPTVRTFSFAFV